jgi:hypothetical protein
MDQAHQWGNYGGRLNMKLQLEPLTIQGWPFNLLGIVYGGIVRGICVGQCKSNARFSGGAQFTPLC